MDWKKQMKLVELLKDVMRANEYGNPEIMQAILEQHLPGKPLAIDVSCNYPDYCDNRSLGMATGFSCNECMNCGFRAE